MAQVFLMYFEGAEFSPHPLIAYELSKFLDGPFLNLNFDRMIAALKVCKHRFIENKAKCL